MEVKVEHFTRAALEIGRNGDNDTLPYDIDSVFIRDKASDLATICFNLFQSIETAKSDQKVSSFINKMTIGSERLLVPSGSYGFRITTKIHPFWNLYLNGIALALAEANEAKRSDRVHSYRLGNDEISFFDGSKSWRAYKEATLQEPSLRTDTCVVVQTDISSFYEHVYHHRLENILNDICDNHSSIARQIIQIISQLTAGRSFGLPIGGQCARVLAEIMMTPIDQMLNESGVLWHRYVDDFTLICNSQQEAYKALSILSHTLADYGFSLNRSKTTFLSSKHYIEYINAQLGEGDGASAVLRELDLHFDPYSDTANADYEQLKKSFNNIDIQFLLNLEREKSQPDSFVLAQIGRALKFQSSQVASQLCATLLDPHNLDSFRASWSKIMRRIYSVRANSDFSDIFEQVDELLDRIPDAVSHLLMPESNLLHYLKSLRFKRTETRGAFVRTTYDEAKSQTVKRACIECWQYWVDRANFTSLRNNWQNLTPDEQRMLWFATAAFGDEGLHMQRQLKASLDQTWRLGFEIPQQLTFASCYQNWVVGYRVT